MEPFAITSDRLRIGASRKENIMMTGITVETVLNQIIQLSAPDQARLYKILATGGIKLNEANGTAVGRGKTKPLPIPEPNLRWIADHKAEYAGQWVALDGDRLIAAGETEREVANAAKADGAYLPLIAYIPHPDEPTFVGL